jgi:hypothetical protein
MKYYLSLDNNVFAYEADGSQDAYIKPGLTPITVEQANALLEQKRLELVTSQPAPINPADKLKQFLAANPDVLALIS